MLVRPVGSLALDRMIVGQNSRNTSDIVSLEQGTSWLTRSPKYLPSLDISTHLLPLIHNTSRDQPSREDTKMCRQVFAAFACAHYAPRGPIEYCRHASWVNGQQVSCGEVNRTYEETRKICQSIACHVIYGGKRWTCHYCDKSGNNTFRCKSCPHTICHQCYVYW